MADIILPVIPHADVTLNPRNRVVIQMHDGWVFYDRIDYQDYVDDDGNPREPYPDEISYFRYGVFSPTSDFANRIVVVAESEVPADQIYSVEQPKPETEVM